MLCSGHVPEKAPPHGNENAAVGIHVRNGEQETRRTVSLLHKAGENQLRGAIDVAVVAVAWGLFVVNLRGSKGNIDEVVDAGEEGVREHHGLVSDEALVGPLVARAGSVLVSCVANHPRELISGVPVCVRDTKRTLGDHSPTPRTETPARTRV